MIDLHQKLFTLVHTSSLIYNTCWEDPRLDRQAFKFTADDRVLMITSAGCNALDYVLGGAGHVDCVDINPRQNFLLELKLAAMQALEWPEFFQMFGLGWMKNPHSTYARLRPFLSAEAANYWQKQIKIFARSKISPSFYFRGASGVLARFMNVYIDKIARVREGVEKVLESDSIQEQRRIYVREVRPKFWSRGAGYLSRNSLVLSCAGVPPAQAAGFDGAISEFVKRAVDTVFAKLPCSDNYFWRVYLTGGYTPDCCPEYLREENFLRLRELAPKKVRVSTCTLEQKLRENREKPYTKVTLLDHMDWLYGKRPDLLQKEWQALAANLAPGATVIWRSARRDPTFVNSLEVQRNGKTVRAGEILGYDDELASFLHKRDRVHTYSSFAVATMN